MDHTFDSTTLFSRQPLCLRNGITPNSHCVPRMIGESLCLLGYGTQSCYRRSRKKKIVAPHLENQEGVSIEVPADQQPSAPPRTNSISKTRLAFVFLLPTVLDLVATTTMFFGLLMACVHFFPSVRTLFSQTTPSVYQMLRGALVVFTAIGSVLFLKARLGIEKWIGVALVCAGLAGVGTISVFFGPPSRL